MMRTVPPFTDALKKGHGRAMAILRADPDSPALQAELLAACKVNLTYDPQCEKARGPYLCRLIHETGQARTIWVALLDEIAKDEAADERDTVQMFEILCLLAAHDATLDRGPLTGIVQRADFDGIGNECMRPYVALQGIEGLTFCIKHFGHVIGRKDFNEDYVFSWLKDTLSERDGPVAAAEQLRNARAHDSKLDQLLSLVEIRDPSKRAEPPKLDRAGVADLVARGRQIPWPWRRDATPEDLEWAAHQLLVAPDDKQALGYCRVFMRRDYPLQPSTLFQFVQSNNHRLVQAATDVLSRITAPEIRTLALNLFTKDAMQVYAIRLLSSNLQPGDFTRIEQALQEATADEDTYHHVGHAVLEVIRNVQHPLEESRNSLLHLYEHEPCSECREYAVSELFKLGDVPHRIIDECRFDSVPGTATLARQASS